MSVESSVPTRERTCGQVVGEFCTSYAKDPKVIFIGYNTVKGSRMYGTLNNVPESQCIESPVAENLMMGMAIGLALSGYKPVVCFERHDFLLLALDALVNHADKLPQLSGGQFKLPIVVRAIVGGTKPLHAGPQHTQDYTTALYQMLKNTHIDMPASTVEFKRAWGSVGHTASGVVVIIEHRDWYDLTFDQIGSKEE